MNMMDIMQLVTKFIEQLAGQCSSEDKAKIKNTLMEFFEMGTPPAQAMKYPEDELELMYSYSVSLYEGGKYSDARNGFHQLFTLNAQDPRYSFGYAASLHKLKAYEKAAEYYIVAANIDKSNPAPWGHAADCYMQLKNLNVAYSFICKGIQVAGDHPAHAHFKADAMVIKEILKKEIEAVPEEASAAKGS